MLVLLAVLLAVVVDLLRVLQVKGILLRVVVAAWARGVPVEDAFYLYRLGTPRWECG